MHQVAHLLTRQLVPGQVHFSTRPGASSSCPRARFAPAIASRTEGISLLPLETLVELKLASGLSAPQRLKDLADVLELIRAAKLPANLADRLDTSMREKYRELWNAAQAAPEE
jgi:hypothetical protein